MSEAFKFNNTKGVLNKIGSDLNKVRRIYEVFIQLIFLGYYSYNVWKHENIYLFIINIVLLSIFVVYFILYMITFFKTGIYDSIIRKKVHRYLTDFKILVRLSTIGLSIFTMVHYGATTLDKVFLIGSVIGLVLQLLLRIFQVAYDKYSKMLMTAFNMDIEDIKGSALGRTVLGVKEVTTNPKATFFHIVNRGLSRIDNLLHGPDMSEAIVIDEDKDQGLKSRIDEMSIVQKEKNEAKEKARREARYKKLKEEKEKSRDLLKGILPKKKKKNKKDETIVEEPKQIAPPKE